MDTYKIGNGSPLIKLSADIIVVTGLAASRAIVFNVDSSEPGIAVAHSKDATGDIKPANSINEADPLNGKRLSVFTKIDLLGNSTEERQIEFERLNAIYTLTGGEDGDKDFDSPDKFNQDDDFFVAFLNKNIDLI